VGAWPQCFGYPLKHSFEVLQDVVVPKSQYPPTFARQERVAPVVIARQGVLSAIGFDNQTRFKTDKIDDIRRYRKLSPKPPAKLILTQHPPQRALCVRRSAA
jgi:hypothetical protein